MRCDDCDCDCPCHDDYDADKYDLLGELIRVIHTARSQMVPVKQVVDPQTATERAHHVLATLLTEIGEITRSFGQPSEMDELLDAWETIREEAVSAC